MKLNRAIKIFFLVFVVGYVDKLNGQVSDSIQSSDPKNYYVGSEIGIKWDKFEYHNTTGYRENLYTLNGIFGFYIGTRLKNINLETGFYGFYTATPVFSYDENKNKLQPTGIDGYMAIIGSSSMDSWIVPLRLRKEVFDQSEKVYLTFSTGLNTIISRSRFIGSEWAGHWSNLRNGVYTEGVIVRRKRLELGVEVGLSGGVRIKKKLDLYLQGRIYNAFGEILNNDITHTLTDGSQIYATNYYHGVSYSFTIGLKYNSCL